MKLDTHSSTDPSAAKKMIVVVLRSVLGSIAVTLRTSGRWRLRTALTDPHGQLFEIRISFSKSRVALASLCAVIRKAHFDPILPCARQQDMTSERMNRTLSRPRSSYRYEPSGSSKSTWPPSLNAYNLAKPD